MLSSLRIPFQCVWCHKSEPEASFNKSHVLPQCVGNQHQQVLPPGIVCADCNLYFGSKVEPVLLEDPIFHAIAVVLSVVDPSDMEPFREHIFDERHRPEGKINKHLVIKGHLDEQKLSVDLSYKISGTMVKEYNPRSLQFLSRAVHKIAFESLAWNMYVEGHESPLDLLSPMFDPVRDWARWGQPTGSVRPVIRKPAVEIKHEWKHEVWKFGEHFGVELNLFGDWYSVSLTSVPQSTLADLVTWVDSSAQGVWYIGNKLGLVVDLGSSQEQKSNRTPLTGRE